MEASPIVLGSTSTSTLLSGRGRFFGRPGASVAVESFDMAERPETDGLEGKQPTSSSSSGRGHFFGRPGTSVAVESSEMAERPEIDVLEGKQLMLPLIASSEWRGSILAWDGRSGSGRTWTRKGRRPAEGRTSSERAARLVRVGGCRCCQVK